MQKLKIVFHNILNLLWRNSLPLWCLPNLVSIVFQLLKTYLTKKSWTFYICLLFKRFIVARYSMTKENFNKSNRKLLRFTDCVLITQFNIIYTSTRQVLLSKVCGYFEGSAITFHLIKQELKLSEYHGEAYRETIVEIYIIRSQHF